MRCCGRTPVNVYFDFFVEVWPARAMAIAWPCAALCADPEPRAANMVCVLRGSCWKDANACGDAGPVGKKLAMGEDGGDV